MGETWPERAATTILGCGVLNKECVKFMTFPRRSLSYLLLCSNLPPRTKLHTPNHFVHLGDFPHSLDDEVALHSEKSPI